MTALLVVVAAYFLLPLVWLAISTTKTRTSLFQTGMFSLPSHLALFNNLRQVGTYGGGLYWRWYANSLLYSGATGLLSTSVCSLVGYAIWLYRFRGRRVIRSMIFGSLIIPGATLTIPIFLLVRFLHLTNTYPGVIIPGIASSFGAYFLLVYIGEAMPLELVHSARVDGAGEWRIFGSICLPIIRPGLATYFLIAFVSSWNNFFLPLLILSKPTLYPVTLGIEGWTTYLTSAGAGVPPYAEIITGSFLSMLPLVVLFPVLRKHIAAGMISGGIKM